MASEGVRQKRQWRVSPSQKSVPKLTPPWQSVILLQISFKATSVTRLGDICKVLGNNFACKSSPKPLVTFWAILKSINLGTNSCGYLFGQHLGYILLQYLVTLKAIVRPTFLHNPLHEQLPDDDCWVATRKRNNKKETKKIVFFVKKRWSLVARLSWVEHNWEIIIN